MRSNQNDNLSRDIQIISDLKETFLHSGHDELENEHAVAVKISTREVGILIALAAGGLVLGFLFALWLV